MVERADVGRPRARLAVGLVAIAVCAGLVVGLTTWLGGTGHGDAPPRHAEASYLVGFWSDYSSGRWTEDGEWATAGPLILRNTSGKAVELISVAAMGRSGVDIGEIGMLGPQQPSLTPFALPGWPPEDGFATDVVHFGRADIEAVRGFEIPPGPRNDPTVPTDEHGVPFDQPNDATPVFQLRRRPGVDIGSIDGIRVTYRRARRTVVQEFPRSHVDLCDRAAFDRRDCPGSQARG